MGQHLVIGAEAAGKDGVEGKMWMILNAVCCCFMGSGGSEDF